MENSESSSNKKGFWDTTLGAITKITALVTAITGLVLAVTPLMKSRQEDKPVTSASPSTTDNNPSTSDINNVDNTEPPKTVDNKSMIYFSWEVDYFQITIPASARISFKVEFLGLYETEVNLQTIQHHHSKTGYATLKSFGNYDARSNQRERVQSSDYRNSTDTTQIIYLEPRHKRSIPDPQKPWLHFSKGYKIIPQTKNDNELIFGFEDAGDDDFDDLKITLLSDVPIKLRV